MKAPRDPRDGWRPVMGRLRGERGTSMVEYTILVAVIALSLLGILSFFGSWTGDHLGVGGLSVQYGDYVAGECPAGNWDMAHIDSPEAAAKKNSTNVNQNGDNYVCVKSDISGNGNTSQTSNAKDNDTEPVDNA